MENVISLSFYLDVERYFRSKKLKNEFLRRVYDLYMEKEDTKGRKCTFSEINKYIDLEAYCKKTNQIYTRNSSITVRSTFLRDTSSEYAKENGLVDEWNKKTARLKKSSLYNDSSLKEYVNGDSSALTQARANTYVSRCGSEEDVKSYNTVKAKNIKIGKNATFSDSETAYKIYKENGLNSKELKEFLESRGIDSKRRNGLLAYYIDNGVNNEDKEQEYRVLNGLIEAEKREQSRKHSSKRVDTANRIFEKLLSFNESNLDIALAKLNQEEELSKNELLSNLDVIRTSGKNNSTCNLLYLKFMDMYKDEEIIDNKMFELIEYAKENEEAAGLRFLYETKRTGNDGIKIIRGMVGNGIVGEWEVVPLKKAIARLTPQPGYYLIQEDHSLLNTEFKFTDGVPSQEEKEQALKFLKDNNMEINMQIYQALLRNHIKGNMNIYGTTKKEIFGSSAKVKTI